MNDKQLSIYIKICEFKQRILESMRCIEDLEYIYKPLRSKSDQYEIELHKGRIKSYDEQIAKLLISMKKASKSTKKKNS